MLIDKRTAGQQSKAKSVRNKWEGEKGDRRRTDRRKKRRLEPRECVNVYPVMPEGGHCTDGAMGSTASGPDDTFTHPLRIAETRSAAAAEVASLPLPSPPFALPCPARMSGSPKARLLYWALPQRTHSPPKSPARGPCRQKLAGGEGKGGLPSHCVRCGPLIAPQRSPFDPH